MADFRILKDARAWFKDVYSKDEGFTIDFEVYYFCLMAGLATGQKRSDLSTTETTELVQNFPGNYKDKGKIIVSVFLARHLASLGVTLTDKKIAHNEISKLINPSSPNYLSEDGMKELNKYAAAGYDEIITWFEERPRTLESFLRIYSLKLESSTMEISI
jgi:hypothetical protein